MDEVRFLRHWAGNGQGEGVVARTEEVLGMARLPDCTAELPFRRIAWSQPAFHYDQRS
jgi:hypothetical protein